MLYRPIAPGNRAAQKGGNTMPLIRIMPLEEAKNLRKVREAGPRRQRMDQFEEYAKALLDHPEQAVIYEDLDEDPQKFVLSLRGTFRRLGAPVTVRKVRSSNQVRAWMTESNGATATAAPETPAASDADAEPEEESTEDDADAEPEEEEAEPAQFPTPLAGTVRERGKRRKAS